jgi:hypothetical protein
VRDDGLGKEIVGQIDLHSGSFSVMISMSWKVFRIGFWKAQARGVIDYDAIWFKEPSPVATELRRDWRKPPGENLGDLRITSTVSEAMIKRSGRTSFEQSAGKGFEMPSPTNCSPCQLKKGLYLT